MAGNTYQYRALTTGGSATKGVIDADSPQAAAGLLRQQGLTVLELHPARGGLSLAQVRLTRPVKTKELAFFARQLAVMLTSGLPINRSLAVLAEQTSNRRLRQAIIEIKTDVEGGAALSAAMQKHPRIFPALMVSLVRAGETSGALDVTLRQIADSLETEVRLTAKVKAAMVQPLVVAVIALAIFAGLIVFAVPVFERIYADLDAQLPLPTQILVAVSQVARVAAPFVLVGAIAAVVGWRRIGPHPRVRAVVDPLKLRIPVFGSLMQKRAMARFAHNLGTLMAAGVPVLQALDIVADTAGSIVVARAVRQVQDGVRQGEPIATQLAEHKVFPSLVVQMVNVGEAGGAVDQMLLRVAHAYDVEVETTSESLTALVNPLMTLVVGALVLPVVIALYMPLFGLFTYIG